MTGEAGALSSVGSGASGSYGGGPAGASDPAEEAIVTYLLGIVDKLWQHPVDTSGAPSGALSDVLRLATEGAADG